MAQTDFTIGKDHFDDLEISDTAIKGFFYFYDRRRRTIVKRFVLAERDRVTYECRVTMIGKGGKFTPRLEFSIRDNKKRIAQVPADDVNGSHFVKARVDLTSCHDAYWQLFAYVSTFPKVEIPRGKFSLVSPGEGDIVEALRKRGAQSLRSIIRQLSSSSGVTLSQEDINELLKRKDRLLEFEGALGSHQMEGWWQDFFERNKWIFGYGLNYEILRSVQNQPHYSGMGLDGSGDQRGDYLAATKGDLSFTVLVEIKTPNALLVQGKQEVRRGTWSLSKELVDAVAQLQTNVDKWNTTGSKQLDNFQRLQKEMIYTVQPKGILIIGLSRELADESSKHETFQRFRKSMHGIDILTFDELYHRAKFIVDHRD
jgi:hypothetical protein